MVEVVGVCLCGGGQGVMGGLPLALGCGRLSTWDSVTNYNRVSR